MNQEQQSYTFTAPDGKTITTEALSYDEALDWLRYEVGEDAVQEYIYRGE